jgi:hypothetical protein
VVSGLVGKYTGESWNAGTTTLVDETGSGNNTISNRGGTISVATGTTGLKYIYGGTTAGLTFPSTILPATYTLLMLTRYNGPNRSRIMDGLNNNWLSGHWGSSDSQAYHEGWISGPYGFSGTTNWILSADQNSFYRSNQVTRGTSGGNASTQLTLHNGYYVSLGEQSDWAFHCLFVYNRTLTLQEIIDMENYIITMWNPFG